MDSLLLLQLGVALLGAFAVASFVFTLSWPYLSGEKQTEKRFNSVVESRASRNDRRAAADQGAQRRKAVTDTLKSIEEEQKKSKRASLRVSLKRAGLEVSPYVFYAASLVCGLAFFAFTYILIPTFSPFVWWGVAIVGAIGVPPWVLSFLIKRRQAKFIDELPNAIDVIVRGVKSGLPLNECLSVIARESAEPLASEFREVIDTQRAGVPLPECFDRLCVRMPLAEMRFLAIVIGIQQSAGGSMSEALNNLSGVLRGRKQLAAKVKALSAEAKASAVVLGILPFFVMGSVQFTQPDYLQPLWTTSIGQFIIGAAVLWMLIGILVMRQMINFKY